ncbi:MAG TPA: dipeptidase [Thermoanaerobaculia bacterium]|nr:dipeptidase [Thermoanaerobaculia bacterium]
MKMRTPGLLLACLILLPAAHAETLAERAARLQRSAIVVDTHEDLPEELQKQWIDIGVRQKTGQVDIPRLKEGGVTAPFFAAYVPARFAETGGSAKKALELIDLIRRLVEARPADLVFADSPEGVRAAKRNGKIAVLIGIEGGHAIENSLGALSAFTRLGARYMTLTHTNSNAWADSAGSFFTYGFDPKKYAVHNGLTDFGRQVVLEMNRLGMLVDVSHVSDKTIEHVLAVSKAPVFASHSSCRALANMPRNLSDDQIRAIGAKGGVVMINFSSTFLDQRVIDDYVAKKKAAEREIALLSERYKADPGKRDTEIAAVFDRIQRIRAPWTAVVDHIEHALKIGGPQSVGLGTDYDGIDDPPEGLEDISRLPRITEELLRRGHSEEEVRGVLGENFLKFWERADAAAKSLPPRTEPLPFSKP